MKMKRKGQNIFGQVVFKYCGKSFFAAIKSSILKIIKIENGIKVLGTWRRVRR